MAKVTKKLQVTIPKAVADAHGIRPGADLSFESAGDVIRVRPRTVRPGSTESGVQDRLRAFDEATERQRSRDALLRASDIFDLKERGWRREDLYTRGVPR